jgi:uncharacterized protein YbjT (DUF2867 family)
MILVVGAAGKTGQAVIRALLKREARIRAFVLRPEQSHLVESLGVAEVVVGDMRDPTAFRQATLGVSAVYQICSNMNPDEVTIGQIAIRAAGENGVHHFVYHSVLHPQTEAMPHHWHKLRVEEALLESQLNFTILQPAAYMQNILAGWPAIVERGLYRVPYAPETRLAMVDLEDVAIAAANILTEAGHDNATYELAGPENLTQTEVAAILESLLQRPVRTEQIPLDVWSAGARRSGMGTYQLETLVKMFEYYEQYHFDGNSNVLAWLLRRAPTDFRAFVARVAQSEARP